MAAAELAGELPALVLFFVTGVVGYLVVKWFGQCFVVPEKLPTKMEKFSEVSDRDGGDGEHNAGKVEAMESKNQKAEIRARRRQRPSGTLLSEIGIEEASSADLASLTQGSIGAAWTKEHLTTTSVPSGQARSKAAKKGCRSKQRSAVIAEAEGKNVEDPASRGRSDSANPQPSTPVKTYGKLGSESPSSTTAESFSDAHHLDFKLSDATEESDDPECSAASQANSEGHNTEPDEPIMAALQKLQQRLSEASAIKERVEGSAQLGLSSPNSGGTLTQKQREHKENMDSHHSDKVPESRLDFPHDSDDEESDDEDAKYDEALRAILENAQGAKWKSPADLAAPTYSPIPGDGALAPRRAPRAFMTPQNVGSLCPKQQNVIVQEQPSGIGPNSQPLVPCAGTPGLYTNGQQVYYPVYVKVDPDADSALDPKIHAVVEGSDPEYGAYLNYIHSCESVVVMTHSPSCGGACPQLALVPKTPHAKTRSQWSGRGRSWNHQRGSREGDGWNMSWDKAPSQW